MKAVSVAAMAIIFAASTPVMAQQSAGEKQGQDEKINQLIIYGDDECPESQGDEIVVCARLDESERYRIPETLRGAEDTPSKEAWTQRVKAYEYVGASGTLSCSPTGSGGFTGCGLQSIDRAYAEREKDPGKLFGRLIAQKRAERLAGIDAEAEEVERRVEQFEKDRAEREAKQAEARARLDAADAAAKTTDAATAEEELAAPLPQPQ